ncbi:MAG: PQQ-binding-like beta-propeller repeat protein [Salinivirgaceae bacterium]|nr:PQQ-binding-like beta-propeller repeat protein [Salinivirgaceae bacterium]
MIFLKKRHTLFIIICLLITNITIGQKWEGWRGLDKQAKDQTNNPTIEWSTSQNVQWKTKLEGEGHSSPVIFEDFVFISSAERIANLSKLNTIIIRFILLASYLMIAFVFFKLIKNQTKSNHSRRAFIQNLLTSILLGLVLFSFTAMYWSYFHEKSKMTDRIIATWLFSGSVVSFLYILSILSIPNKRFLKPITSLAIIPFVFFLIINRPFPAYYALKRLLKYHNVETFSLTVQSVYLPIIAIFLFTAVSFLKNKNTIHSKSEINFKKNSIPIYYVSFLTVGIFGFFLAPLITLAKVMYRKFANGAPSFIKISEIFDFTYPYFLIVLSFGFVIIFIFQYNRVEISKSIKKWTFPILFIYSIVFFILLNYSTNDLRYKRCISCYNRHSGELIWKTSGLKGPAVVGSNYNTQATPTPVVKDRKIYSYFGSAGMMCTDFDGNIVWTNTELPYTCIHGVGASPVKSSKAIILCNATPSSPYITALDPLSGKTIWKNNLPKWKSDHGEYRTPTVLMINNKEQIIEWNFSKNELRFYDAETGEICTRFKPNWKKGGECIISLIISSDTIFLADKLSIHALSINKIINKKDPIIWGAKLKRKGPDTSSAIKLKNHIFLISDNGYISCINAKTGEIIWQNKVLGVFSSSIVSSDNYIYFTDTKCKTTVIENNSEMKIVSQNELNEEIHSTIAPVDGKLYIRSKENLWCISNKKE